MILLIFEGEKQEPRIFQTIKYLYFSDLPETDIQVSYCSNIHVLYDEMKKLDVFGDSADIVTVLKDEQKAHPDRDQSLLKFSRSDQFSQIYLFFDYDIQKLSRNNKKKLKEQNKDIQQMLEYFNDETIKGKLYINYPMIESIRYFKELPDYNYYKYKSYIYLQSKFKQKAANFSYYKDIRFIAFDYNTKKQEVKIPKKNEDIEKVRKNWSYVKELSVKKANYICSGINDYPNYKFDINQKCIFENQIRKYVNKLWKQVSIINAFPLFLYDFFK